jgi:hypothetical protein
MRPHFFVHTPHTPHATLRYRYVPPVSHLPGGAEPAIAGRSWTMTASVTRAPGDDGILFTTGTQNSGLVFFVKDDRLCFDYNAFGDHTLVKSEAHIPDGATQLTARFDRTGQTGSIELRIDGSPCGRADVPWVMRMTGSIGADIGRGTNSPVCPEITGRFPFAGTLHELVIDLDASRSERERAERAAARYDSEMARQ